MKKYMLGLALIGALTCGQMFGVKNETRQVLKYGFVRSLLPVLVQIGAGCDAKNAAMMTLGANSVWIGIKELLVDAEVLSEDGPQKGWTKVVTSLADDMVPVIAACTLGIFLRGHGAPAVPATQSTN